MKSLALSIVLALSAASLPAQAGDNALSMCDVSSDYRLQFSDDALRFRNDGGNPAELRFADGRLYADGVEQALDPAGQARVAEFERAARALVPEIKAIAIDAVALAADAVGQVAVAFGSSRGEELQQRLQGLQHDVQAGIDAALRDGSWDEQRFSDDIEQLVGELVPVLAGEIAAAAVSAALSGDEQKVRDIERRAEQFERAIEQAVEGRAEQIEQRAEALCSRVVDLHQLQTGLRLADGRPLQLLRM